MKISDNVSQTSYQQNANTINELAAAVQRLSTNEGQAGTNENVFSSNQSQQGTDQDSVVDTEFLLNIAFQILNNTKKQGGVIGWLQENSSTISNVVKGVQFARQVIPAAKSGAALTSEAAKNIANAGKGVDGATNSIGGATSTVGTVLGYAQQAYSAYKILSSDASDEVKAQMLAKQAGLLVADMYTFGLASVAYGVLSQSKTFRKIEGEMMKYDGVMQGAGSLGKIWGGDGGTDDYLNLATGGMFTVAGNAFGFSLSHKSTETYQAERAKGAFDAAVTDEDKAYVENMYTLKQEAAPDNIIRDEANPYNGMEWKWEEQKPLLKGEDVWGFSGFQTAFPDFISGYTEGQRREIAQAALDENLLTSDKGNIIFSNSDKNADGVTSLERIQQIASEIKAGASPATPGEA